jgi:hypothetical protein
MVSFHLELVRCLPIPHRSWRRPVAIASGRRSRNRLGGEGRGGQPRKGLGGVGSGENEGKGIGEERRGRGLGEAVPVGCLTL